MDSKGTFSKAVFRNNWLALAIQGIIVVITLVVYLSGLSIIWVFLSAPVGIFVYIYFARKWLQPLESHNWLSVMAPVFVIGVISIASVHFGSMRHLPAIHPDYYDWRVYIHMLQSINSAAQNMTFLVATITDSAFSALGGRSFLYVEEVPIDDPTPGWFIAIFIPSLLMYLGLRLKIRQVNKEQTEG